MSTTHPTHAKVVHGPVAWLGQTGLILKEEEDRILVALECRDDGKDGVNHYQVWMPKAAVVLVAAPAA